MTEAAPPPSADTPKRERIGPHLNDLFEMFLGFDLRVLRTARDLALRPLRVARQAATGDIGDYLGQVRLFIVFMSLTTLFLAVTKVADALTVETFFQARPDLAEAYAEELAQSGATLADVNDAFRNWFNYFIVPMNLMHIVVFALVFRLIAPGFTIFGHALLYITAINASVIVGFPVVIAASVMFSVEAEIIGLMLSLVQLTYLFLFVWVFMRRTILGGVLKSLAVFLVFVLATMATGIGMWWLLNVLADGRFGLGPLTFLIQAVVSEGRAAGAAP